MPVTAQRTMSQLKRECANLGITWPQHPKYSHKEPTKAQVIHALQQYYLPRIYPHQVPRHLGLMMQLETPMLACQFRELDASLQESIWDDSRWIAEEKLDGVRMLSFFVETQGQLVHPQTAFMKQVHKPSFYSRNISVKNYLPVDYSTGIWLGDDIDWSQVTDRFILDTELISLNASISTVLERRAGGVVTETMLQAVTALLALFDDDSIELQKQTGRLKFQAFDVLWWNGKWVTEEPYHVRRGYLIQAIKQLTKAGLNFGVPRMVQKGKKEFTEQLLKSGGEGVILKHIKSKYLPQQSRSHRVWVKYKRSVSMASKMAGLNDTIEGWISGFEEADDQKGFANLVGSLKVSIWLKKDDGTEVEHEIARVSNIELGLRNQMTDCSSGRPVLKPEYYGKVVEIDGMDITSRSLRFSHARLIRIRDDRSQDTCEMTETFLRSLVL